MLELTDRETSELINGLEADSIRLDHQNGSTFVIAVEDDPRFGPTGDREVFRLSRQDNGRLLLEDGDGYDWPQA